MANRRKKYTKTKLESMSIDELIRLDKELDGFDGKSRKGMNNRLLPQDRTPPTRKLQKGGRATPTQQKTFTLPDGRTIELPNYGGGQRNSSRDYGLPDNFDIQIYHPDADVAYGYIYQAWTMQIRYLFIFGNITILGQEASGAHFGGNEGNYSTGGTGFCMNGPNDPTGNCDILILYHNDTVIGFENIYNSVDANTWFPNWPDDIGSPGDWGSYEYVDYYGVSTIPYISNTAGLNYDLYPSLNTPGFITDILLYRTSTNSFYRPENIDFVMNQIEIIINAGYPEYVEGFNNLSNSDIQQFSNIQSHLNFVPIGEQQPQSLPACQTDNDCRPGYVCRRGQCVEQTGVGIQDTLDCSCECLPGGNCSYCEAANSQADPEWFCTTGGGANWCVWECDDTTQRPSPPEPTPTGDLNEKQLLINRIKRKQRNN